MTISVEIVLFKLNENQERIHVFLMVQSQCISFISRHSHWSVQMELNIQNAFSNGLDKLKNCCLFIKEEINIMLLLWKTIANLKINFLLFGQIYVQHCSRQNMFEIERVLWLNCARCTCNWCLYFHPYICLIMILFFILPTRTTCLYLFVFNSTKVIK